MPRGRPKNAASDTHSAKATKPQKAKGCVSRAVVWFREGRAGWLALVTGLLPLVVFDWLPLGLERRLALEGMIFQLIGVGV
jgi:hypothetical protein